jgi:hypothetical protein
VQPQRVPAIPANCVLLAISHGRPEIARIPPIPHEHWVSEITRGNACEQIEEFPPKP